MRRLNFSLKNLNKNKYNFLIHSTKVIKAATLTFSLFTFLTRHKNKTIKLLNYFPITCTIFNFCIMHLSQTPAVRLWENRMRGRFVNRHLCIQCFIKMITMLTKQNPHFYLQEINQTEYSERRRNLCFRIWKTRSSSVIINVELQHTYKKTCGCFCSCFMNTIIFYE